MLRLLVLAIAAAVATGWAARGRLSALATTRVAALPLTFASAGLIVAARFAGGTAGTALQIAAGIAVGTFLALNARRHAGLVRVGFAVVALGWGMNAAVITANGGMPLSLTAYAASGQTDVPTPGEAGFFAIEIATEDTALRPLGDVIPLAPLRVVASAGDLLLLAGIFLVIVAGMRRDVAAPGRARGTAVWAEASPIRLAEITRHRHQTIGGNGRDIRIRHVR